MSDIHKSLESLHRKISLKKLTFAFLKLEEIFKVDAHAIQLSDQFGKELGPSSRIFPWYDSMECEDFYDYIEERAKKFDINNYSMTNVRSYIEFEAMIESLNVDAK